MKEALTRAVTRAVLVWFLVACYPVSNYAWGLILHGGDVHWLAPR